MTVYDPAFEKQFQAIFGEGVSLPKFAIGDTVYRVKIDSVRKTLDCPDCLNTRVWWVRSPVGQKHSMKCPRCSNNKMAPLLTEHELTYHEYRCWTEKLTIGSVRLDQYTKPKTYEYMCVETGIGSGTIYREETLYISEDAAKFAAASQELTKNETFRKKPEMLEFMKFGVLALDEAWTQKYWDVSYHSWDRLRQYRQLLDNFFEEGREHEAPATRIKDLGSEYEFTKSYCQHYTKDSYFGQILPLTIKLLQGDESVREEPQKLVDELQTALPPKRDKEPEEDLGSDIPE